MKKYIVLIIATAFLGTGCKKKYEEGFASGQADGIVEGRIDGYDEGYADGNAEGNDQGYDTGYAEGYASGHDSGYTEGEAYFSYAGYDEGHADGYQVGHTRGDIEGFNHGYDVAYDEFYDVGYAEGKPVGQVDGYADGKVDGIADGKVDGYNDGYDDAYDEGWDDGYDDAYYGYSGKSNNPQVKMIAMLNADLFNYSKLQKFDSKAVVASMGLSHANNGTVDMEKLASLKEQHYLNQMAVQLNAKFGLSVNRAKEVAIVAHQFNKLSGTRELTEKDANSFAMEVAGVNMKEVENAIKKSLKGDSALLNEVLGSISKRNGISSENVNEMISQIFF